MRILLTILLTIVTLTLMRPMVGLCMWGYTSVKNNSDFSHDLTGNEVEGLEQMERKLHLDIDEDPDRPGASYLLPDSLIP